MDTRRPDRVRLLKAVYEAVDWEQLYRLVPDADRQQVDELFQDLRCLLEGAQHEAAPAAEKPQEALELEPSPARAALVAGGAALLYCDGAARGNPGPAGIGVVIRTPDGRDVLAWGQSIGEATNNVAEYRAVLAGLERALELDVKQVKILCDSELLVKQLGGQYRVKNPALKSLHARATELLGRFASWEVAHVGRDANLQADRLARRYARPPRKPPDR